MKIFINNDHILCYYPLCVFCDLYHYFFRRFVQCSTNAESIVSHINV